MIRDVQIRVEDEAIVKNDLTKNTSFNKMAIENKHLSNHRINISPQ
jgi:hypothetical protein